MGPVELNTFKLKVRKKKSFTIYVFTLLVEEIKQSRTIEYITVKLQ